MKKPFLWGGAIIFSLVLCAIAWVSFNLAPAWSGGLARTGAWELFYRDLTKTSYYDSGGGFLTRNPEIGEILRSSKQLKIYTLRPNSNEHTSQTVPTTKNDSFVGYAVTNTQIINARTRKQEFVNVLSSGLNKRRSGRWPMGFEPQYGVSATLMASP